MTERDKSTVLLEHYLKKLKLPTMLREYAAVSWTGRNGLLKGVSKMPTSP